MGNRAATPAAPGGKDGDPNAAAASAATTPTAPTAPSLRVLCYGDSLTAGFTIESAYMGTYAPWAPTLAEALGGVPCDHIGMSGWTTAQMKMSARSDANFDVCKIPNQGLAVALEAARGSGGGPYTHVLIMAGTNDLGVCGAEEIHGNLAALHALCHAQGAKTAALSIPQSRCTQTGKPAAFVGERQRAANGMLEAYAAGSGGRCLYVDVAAAVPWVDHKAAKAAGEEPMWEGDGLHMTAHGYAVFAERLAPLVREWICGTGEGVGGVGAGGGGGAGGAGAAGETAGAPDGKTGGDDRGGGDGSRGGDGN